MCSISWPKHHHTTSQNLQCQILSCLQHYKVSNASKEPNQEVSTHHQESILCLPLPHHLAMWGRHWATFTGPHHHHVLFRMSLQWCLVAKGWLQQTHQYATSMAHIWKEKHSLHITLIPQSHQRKPGAPQVMKLTKVGGPGRRCVQAVASVQQEVWMLRCWGYKTSLFIPIIFRLVSSHITKHSMSFYNSNSTLIIAHNCFLFMIIVHNCFFGYISCMVIMFYVNFFYKCFASGTKLLYDEHLKHVVFMLGMCNCSMLRCYRQIHSTPILLFHCGLFKSKTEIYQQMFDIW